MIFRPHHQPSGIKPPLGTQLNFGHPLAQGLCGFWPMNENGGNILHDLAGYGQGTLGGSTGQPTWENGGIAGADLAFVAANTQKVTVVNNPQYLAGSFSISFFFQIASVGAANCLIGKTSGNSGPFQIYAVSPTGDGSIFEMFLGNDSGFNACCVVKGTTVSINTWYYMTCTFNYNGGGSNTATGSIYINGILNATATGTASNYANDTQNILFGTRGDAGVSFGGKQAYVKLWNRCLSPSEVLFDYINPYAMLNVAKRYAGPLSIVSSINLSASDSLLIGELGETLYFPSGFDAFFTAFRDSLSFSDFVALSKQFSFSFSDQFTPTDLVQFLFSPIANLIPSDSISLTDSSTVQVVNVPQPLSITINDTLNLLDAINNSSIGGGLRLNDTLLLNDSANVALLSILRNYIRRYLNDVV